MKKKKISKFNIDLILLPLLILPLAHIPTGIKTLESLSLKMYCLIPVAIFILTLHKRKFIFNTLSIITASIVFLNLISFLRFGSVGYSAQSLLTILCFASICQTFYSVEHRFETISKFLNISVAIGAITGGYSLIQQLGYDPLSLKTWDSISSTFPNRNFLAGYASFSLLASLFLILKNKKSGIFLIAGAVIIGDSLMLSQTRGAWLAFLAALLLLFFIDIRFLYLNKGEWKDVYKRKAPLFLIIGFCIFSSTWYINNRVREPLSMNERLKFIEDVKTAVLKKKMKAIEATDSFSVKMRYLYWRMAIDMIKEYPVLGRGVGKFREEYMPYLAKYMQLAEYKNADTRIPVGVDNDYLEFWVESGIFNLLLYLLLIGFTFTKAYNFLISKNGTYHDRVYVAGFTVFLSAIIIHGLFHYSLHDPVMGSIFWTLIALINVGVEGRFLV